MTGGRIAFLVAASLALVAVSASTAVGRTSEARKTPPGWHLKATSGVPELNGTFKASGGTLAVVDCPANHLMLAFRWNNLRLAGYTWVFGLNLQNTLHPGKWRLGPAAAILQLGRSTVGEGWMAGENGSITWHGYVDLAWDLRHGSFKAILPPTPYGAFTVPVAVTGTFACP